MHLIWVHYIHSCLSLAHSQSLLMTWWRTILGVSFWVVDDRLNISTFWAIALSSKGKTGLKPYRFFLLSPAINYTSEKPREHWLIIWRAPKYHKNEEFLLSWWAFSSNRHNIKGISVCIASCFYDSNECKEKEIVLSELHTAAGENDSTGKPQTCYWVCMWRVSVLH